MTKIVNGIIIFENTPDDMCEYCGEIGELRPYGKNGAKICYECGIKNKEETEKNMKDFLSQAKPINPNLN